MRANRRDRTGLPSSPVPAERLLRRFTMGMCYVFSPSLFSLPFVAMDSRTDHIRQMRGIQDLEGHEERLRPPRQQQRALPGRRADLSSIPLTVGTPSYPPSRRILGGCECRSAAGVFSTVCVQTFGPHGDGRISDGPRTRCVRGYPVVSVRCNFLPQARDIIANRQSGLSSCVRMAVRPCAVRRRGYYALEAPTHCVTYVPPYVSPRAGIHRGNLKAGPECVRV